jgi:hypothetical protein
LIESHEQVDKIIPSKIEAPVEEVTGTPVEETGQRANQTDPELEPDNERNRAYYEDELDNNPDNEPFDLSTINQSFHRRLTEDLDKVLKSCRFKRNGTVLELMAGCGRNMDLLLAHFEKVEMLERINTMIKAIKKLSKKP